MFIREKMSEEKSGEECEGSEQVEFHKNCLQGCAEKFIFNATFT